MIVTLICFLVAYYFIFWWHLTDVFRYIVYYLFSVTKCIFQDKNKVLHTFKLLYTSWLLLYCFDISVGMIKIRDAEIKQKTICWKINNFTRFCRCVLYAQNNQYTRKTNAHSVSEGRPLVLTRPWWGMMDQLEAPIHMEKHLQSHLSLEVALVRATGLKPVNSINVCQSADELLLKDSYIGLKCIVLYAMAYYNL